MLTTTEYQEIADKVHHYYELAKKQWVTQLAHWKRPSWNTNLTGTTAGMAHLYKNHIRLNPILYKRDNHVRDSTIGHEIAHLVAFIVYKDHGHGPGWKHVMNVFGLKAERCHSIPCQDLKRKFTYYTYKCSCCEKVYRVKKKMHENVRYTGGHLECPIDNTRLVYNGTIKA